MPFTALQTPHMKALLAPVVAIALSVAVSTSQAQGTSVSPDTAETATHAEGGPRREAAVAGVRLTRERDHTVGEEATPQQGAPTGQAKLLMVIGAAAFVGGLLIGDDAGTAIAVAGLGVGIYGLYLYMR